MEVREQGANERRYVLHFGKELFVTIGAAKNGYDALNVHNVFRKIPRREGDVVEEGQWRRVVELRLQFIIALYRSTNSISKGQRQGRRPREIRRWRYTASGLTPTKRDANSSPREATH